MHLRKELSRNKKMRHQKKKKKRRLKSLAIRRKLEKAKSRLSREQPRVVKPQPILT